MKQVVILIISHKEVLEPKELISLQQCFKILEGYDIHFICPKGLNINGYKLQLGFEPSFHFIDPKWQRTYAQFNKLKISDLLYKKFHEYEYIMFYEPDAFVFKDELTYWCGLGYDYIGSPLLEGRENALATSDYTTGGNGGFSLRKISSHLKILNSFKRIKKMKGYFRDYKKMNWKGQLFHFPSQLFGYLFKNRYNNLLNDFADNEDEFWGNYVPREFEWFNVAPIPEALKFSMEVQPQRMFEDNNKELPFGCHAWWKYNLEFWKPFIEKFGYKI